MTLVVIQTGDGSQTLFDTARNIYFRSLQGARSESDYVFVAASRIESAPAPWRVLELGLGTALNFLATAEALLSRHPQGSLDYVAVEASPLPPEVFAALQQPLRYPWLADLLLDAFVQLQTHPVATLCRGPVRLTVHGRDWRDCSLPADLCVDAIYHDPFAPNDNPEGWTPDCFAWSSRHLSPAGRLVTYGASGAMRRALAAVGLQLASLPGPGPKREMTVAGRHLEALAGAQLLPMEKYQPGYAPQPTPKARRRRKAKDRYHGLPEHVVNPQAKLKDSHLSADHTSHES